MAEKQRNKSEDTTEKGTVSTEKARQKVDEGGRAKKPFIYVTPSKGWQAGHRTGGASNSRAGGASNNRTGGASN